MLDRAGQYSYTYKIEDLPAGEKIKEVHTNYVMQTVFQKLWERHHGRDSVGCGCSYVSNRSGFTILTEAGRLFSWCFSCSKSAEFPVIHSQMRKIAKIAAECKKLLIIDETG